MIEKKYIRLYPSHWLYNAGVVGLIKLDKVENHNQISFEDGGIKIPKTYFDSIDVNKRFFAEEKSLGISIVGKSPLYPNFINSSRKQDKEKFSLFVKSLKRLNNTGNTCGLCTQKHEFSETRIKLLNKVWNSQNIGDFSKFYEGIEDFSNKYNAEIGGAISKFPNGFWNLDSTMHICPLCSFILLHQHLSISKLAWHSQIFINAPSFEIMFYLNQFMTGLMGRSSNEIKEKREILAMSVIEYVTKIKSTLGVWSGMNIEIINKYKVKVADKWEDRIEFYSLPDDVISLLTDRKIAGQLSSLGEFKILNMVLDRSFKRLTETGYRLLREAMSSRKNNKLIDSILFQHSNKKDLFNTGNQILRLYALIQDKINSKTHKQIAYG